jgi:DNA repair protein RadA/Sms
MATTKRSAAPRPAYLCTECGWEAAKWVGRCGECQAWGSLAERGPTGLSRSGPVSAPAVPIGEVSIEESRARTCGVPELDRVLGGGLVPGAVVLLAGEPGVGKSTLLLEVAAQTARRGLRTLYVSGEESAAQVRLRADRCGGVHHELYLAAESDLGALLSHVEQLAPQLLVVDSVQTISAPDVEGVPGGVTQVKEVTAALVRQAKSRGMATLVVGHVTKDGSVAGPRVLEHLVDVVLQFEGERSSRLRLVRASKNRFGPVDEVGCFDLTSDGIDAVTDPSGLFVSRHHQPVPGTCVTIALEGRRPLPVEIQALVTTSAAERPRRATSGLDTSRAAMVLAVLEARTGQRTSSSDVFLSTVGGARLHEPGGDLATALAVASAVGDTVIPPGVVAVGEIGLAGELRRVPDLRRRLGEAARLGFTAAIVPATAEADYASGEAAEVQVHPVADLASALRVLGLGRSRRATPNDDTSPGPSPP